MNALFRSFKKMVPALPFLVVAVGFSTLAVSEASHWPRDRVVEAFSDDAFYYFEIAKNIAAGLGSTFDGISKTNGYHPLWMAALIPVYWLDMDLYSSLVAIRALSALFWVLSIWVFYSLGKYADQTASFATALVPLVYARSFWFSGMESTVSLPLLLAAIYLIVSKNLLSSKRSTGGLVACGFVVAVAVLARLDLVFFVLLLAVFVFFTPSEGGFWSRFRDATWVGLPSVVLISCYMLFNRAFFGTWSPVSGQAKSIGAPFMNLAIVSKYLEFHPIPAPVVRELTVLDLLVVVLIPALVLLRLRSSGTGRVLKGWARPVAENLEKVLYLLVLSNLVQLAYYAFNSSWPLWRWYYYYLPLILALSIPVIVSFLLEQFSERRRLAIAVSLIVSSLMIVKLGRSLMHAYEVQQDLLLNYRTQSLEVADYLNSHFPEHSVFAMGDRAGSLAYQLDRSLVQTEGLVGSIDFLIALEEGSVHQYLRNHGVDFVIYSGGPSSGGDPHPIAQDQTADNCSSVREPKFGSGPKFRTAVCDEDVVYERELKDTGPMGGTVTIWRYRPGLNQSDSLSNH